MTQPNTPRNTTAATAPPATSAASAQPAHSAAPRATLESTTTVAPSALSAKLANTRTSVRRARASCAQLGALAAARACKRLSVPGLAIAGPGEEAVTRRVHARRAVTVASTLSRERRQRAPTVPKAGIRTKREARFAKPVPKDVTAAHGVFKQALATALVR